MEPKISCMLESGQISLFMNDSTKIKQFGALFLHPFIRLHPWNKMAIHGVADLIAKSCAISMLLPLNVVIFSHTKFNWIADAY